MANLGFIKTAFKDYKVGALFRSSPFVIRKVLEMLPDDCKYVIEYGAGDGIITKKILHDLPADGKLIALELNPTFITDLKKISDPRLQVLHVDVRAASKDFSSLGLPRVDAVISGIPFSFFKPDMRKEIVINTHRGLREGGRFIVYQYSTLMKKHLEQSFGSITISYEPRNILPYYIMVAEK